MKACYQNKIVGFYNELCFSSLFLFYVLCFTALDTRIIYIQYRFFYFEANLG